MPVFDPFSNIGTSQVFYQILKGNKNPKAIADAIGTQPPPVIQQLRRLQKIGVVRLGSKEGKVQNYEVNWDHFLALFINRAMQERREKTQEGQILVEDPDPENRETIKTLKNNRYFKRLVQLYLQNVAESIPSNQGTISDAIDNLENALQQSSSFNRSRKFDDPEKQEFFKKMRIWHKRTRSVKTWMDLQLHDAIRKTLKREQ